MSALAQQQTKKGEKMKISIKGLAFVGFAAAVFAQGAMATQEEQDALDRKTVTSKYYADHTFQTIDNITTTSEATSSAAWDSDITYPSMAVLKTVNTAANIGGAGYTQKVASGYQTGHSNESGYETGWNIVLDGNKLTTNLTTDAGTIATGEANGASEEAQAAAVAARAKLATTGAVYDYAEATANKLEYDPTANNNAGDETITGAATAQNNNTSNEKFPTVKNVYEFVKKENGNYQPKVTQSGPKVGVLSSGNGTWETIQASGGQTTDAASTSYLTMTHSTGVYQINISDIQIAGRDVDIEAYGTAEAVVAAAGANATDEQLKAAAEAAPKLTTAKAVYDFVTKTGDNYQPKIDNNDAGLIMIGYNTQSEIPNTDIIVYSSDWKVLNPEYKSGSGAGYIDIAEDSKDSHKMNLILQNVGHAGSNISSATSQQASNGTDKLASAYAVKEYVADVMGGLEIPPMPTACSTGVTSTSGVACALVYAWDAGTPNLQSGDPGYVAPDARLQWTVIANPS